MLINFFAFAQNDFYDKTFGLKNTLEKNELRIYSSNSIILLSSKVFVLKQNKKGKWKAKLYHQSGRDNIYVKNFHTKNGAEFWRNLINIKPQTDTTSTQTVYIDPDIYEINWNVDGHKKKYSFEEPFDSKNKNDEKIKTVYQFFEMIEQKFDFKFRGK